MEGLLDREARLNDHLQSQVDLLMGFLSNQQTARSLPAPPQAPQAPAITQPPAPVHQPGLAPADSAHDVGPKAAAAAPTPQSAAHMPHGTFDEATGDVGAEVMRAMQMVADGADVLQDLDFTMPMRTRTAPAGNGGAPPRSEPSAAPAAPPATPAPEHEQAPPVTSQVPRPTPPPAPPSTSPLGAPMQNSTAAAASSAPVATAGAGSEAGQEEPVETQKASQDGPPPMLNTGDDDIYWVAILHQALLKHGFYCGEEDEEDYFFGTTTQSAVLTFQACNGVAETGVVDEATWRALLGAEADEAFAKTPGTAALAAREARQDSPATATAASGASATQGSKFGGLFDGLAVTAAPAPPSNQSAAAAGPAPPAAAALATGSAPKYTKWPILREGDGDRAVHTLQIKLREHGYYADPDDDKWWNFGPSTLSALTTFQACSGLPESGVCDVGTWLALMGKDASPEDIEHVWSGDSDDEDLEAMGSGRVYLLGEQRWASR